jgi:coproporphyrinogen III oxidase-like Fe-S oxidoreductase
MAALYLHVPFRQSPSPSDESAFTTAVVREMDRYARSPFTNSPVRTLYVGGGRPSLCSVSALRTLGEAVRQKLDVPEIEETTLELRLADASTSALAMLRERGFTRLSIDPRSLVDEELRRALREIRKAGFDSVSIDLFFGGDEQSLSTWKARLHRAVELRVPHFALHEQEPTETSTDEAERADRFAFAMRFLAAKGYEQYELTHFARPGHRSRYQTHVYAHGNVLGLGPGAESFWWADRSDPSTAERWSNVTDVATYVERLRDGASPVAQREEINEKALAREYILLRLRTSDGLDLNVFDDRYGVSLRDHRAATLDRLAADGLIHDDPDRVRLTPRGRRLADAVTRRLIRDT